WKRFNGCMADVWEAGLVWLCLQVCTSTEESRIPVLIRRLWLDWLQGCLRHTPIDNGLKAVEQWEGNGLHVCVRIGE
ncbi:MAG: hypothetical protein Q9198_002954, partial [Flavoplaca austrocitrina]